MSEQKSLVTILMTNYNYGRFIEYAVKSVVAQTYSPLEVIVVDDGSTDNSREVVEDLEKRYRYRFVNFKILPLKPNNGVNAALNRGIPLIEGDVTIIFDSDDFLFAQYVEKTTSVLLENKSQGVGFVYPDNVLIDEHENLLRDKDGKLIVRPFKDFDAELLQKDSYIPGCGATLTDALKAVWPLDPTIRKGTKHERLKGMVAKGYTGRRISKPLFYYRLHDDNNSGIGRRVFSAVSSGEPVGEFSQYWTS